MPNVLASWQALEFEYRKKSADWYWAVWIIVISIAVISVIFNDVLLAVLIIIGAFSLSLLASKRPTLVQYEITSSGVRIADTLYPFETLDSFGFEQYGNAPPRLLIRSKKMLSSLVSIPLSGIHSEEVREILAAHLRQEELHEPLMQKLIEFIGF